MRKRKVLSVLLCAGLIISSALNVNFFANAQVNPTVYSDMNGSSVNAGETIRVPVSIRDNSGLMGWMLTFNYDADVFTPVSVDTGDVINGGIQDSIGGNAVKGSFNVYWAGSENEYYNGVMIYLNLSVNSKAVGNSSIGIAFSQQDTFDADFEDVYLNCENIELNVKNSGYTQYAKVNAFADDVTAGEETDIKLNISEINNVSAVSISINYDSQNFTFVSASSNGAELKSADSDGTVKLTVSNITGSLNNTNFVVVKFKCKDKAKSGKYNFSVLSTDEGIICKGCNITVKPSARSETAEIYADEIKANYGETITIPVQIENNHGIMGYRLDFKYDADMLEPISASCGEDFLQNGQFNDSIGVKDGEFKVLWNNVDEIYSNGTLLTLKFKVLAEEKTDTVISITYSQPDTFNEKYQNVVFDCKNINVNLNQIAEPDLTNFIIKTVSLSLESSITMNFKVLKTALADYENPYVMFECNGKETKVTEYTEQGDYYVFSYPGISPQMMNDTVTGILHATYKFDSKEYVSVAKPLTVKEYVYIMLDRYSSSSYAKLRTLLVDLLNYGAAAQIYMNYKTNSLVNSDLTETQKSWGTSSTLTFTDLKDFNYKKISNPSVEWIGSGLVLNNSVMVRAKFKASDIENKTIKITCNGRTFEYTKDDSENIKSNNDGSYYVYCDEIYANEMSKEILLTVYENGVPCSNTMRYSIESYAKAAQDSNQVNTALKNLTQAMMRYGKSAEAYRA